MSPAQAGESSASSDRIDQFASDLRKLRVQADNPTLSRLEAESGISRTVIAEAFAGRRLPSARTVGGVVRACGGDVLSWLDRRDAIARQATGAREGAAPHRLSLSPRVAVLLAAGIFTSGVVASATMTALVLSDWQIRGESEPQIPVSTGQDPALTPCLDDAAVATSDMREGNSLLEIVWSDRCQAGWGRITRSDGLGSGNTVSVAIYPETAVDGPDRQEATEGDVQSAYTMLVVRPTADTLLCAEGSFTVDGRRIDLGDPLCT